MSSANLGPYGDAIVDELIPAIDSSFRTIATRAGRSLTGGSTGGWESLAQMIFYPQTYSGTFSTCPDPVDLRYHQLVNVYSTPTPTGRCTTGSGWDKETGTIDHSVTDQWRAYDLNQYLQANWATLAPLLSGRLPIYVGDDDTCYLNDAVELLEQWLVTAPANAEIQYGRDQPHCWSPYTSQELVQVMADFMASHPD